MVLQYNEHMEQKIRHKKITKVVTEIEFWRRILIKMARITNEDIKRRTGVKEDTLDYINEKICIW